jgi:hypothetical protein
MNFSELSLPQRVAAHELSVRALQDEVRALRALITALVDVVATATNSPEHEAALAVLLAARNRVPSDGS